ncbi:MAG: ECF transporter S component [Corynebacterium sp.]|nr:ECF transporter S component [Corynebacterium sp.]
MSRTVSNTIAGCSFALMAIIWIYLVATQPEWGSENAKSAATIALVGYGVATIGLIVATIPRIPSQTLAMIPAAVVLNVALGEIVGRLGIPIYVDSLGTLVIAALAGPVAAMATGAIGCFVWFTFNSTILPFAAVYAAVGLIAGLLFAKGGLSKIWWAVLSGILMGLIIGSLSAPVAAFIYGGTAGAGTGAVVTFFQSLGLPNFMAVVAQSALSDPVDKVVITLVTFAVVRSLPRRVLDKFSR